MLGRDKYVLGIDSVHTKREQRAVVRIVPDHGNIDPSALIAVAVYAP